MSQPLKILVKLPSRGRPHRFFKALDSIVNNVKDTNNFLISATLDTDDPTMHNPEVIERIGTYPNTSIAWGTSTSKINAVNRDVPEDGWEVIVIGSDDIYFNLYGFDEIIRTEIANNFPNGDAYLHFREKDSMDMLNVMTVCDKAYYQRFGYIYHPSYMSLWCDNEQTEVAKQLGRYAYIPYEIMLHRNSAYNYQDCPRDEMFDFQQSFWNQDHQNYVTRKAKNFEL